MELRDQIQSTLGSAFRVERELGGGGMSRIFVATDVGLGRPIVVKVLPPDATAQVSIERFKREVRVAARLQHPHIVPLLSAGDTQGLPYYTMPFVPGETLRDRLATRGALPVNEAVHVLRDVASALAYAHGEGVVHRDIKPENIILSGGVAVVADFGVAKAINAAIGGSDRPEATSGPKDLLTGGLTSLGVALGTPAYMSPEQAAADPTVDHRADIYSFGCVAYEMLTGSSPFAGRPFAQMLAAHVQEQPEPLANRCPLAPPALAGLVMSCLAKRPEDRPQSAAALLAALEMDPAISPDGKFVAYVAGAPGRYHIHVRQVAGERSVDVSVGLEGEHTHPTWSPDGSQVAFVANGSAFVVAATGGTPKLLVESPGLPLIELAWSPDATRIAYTNTTGLWVKPVAAGDARRVIEGKLLHSVAWSPDGTRLALTPRRISLSRDGTRMVYDVVRNRSNIWALDIPTGTGAASMTSARPITSENQRIEGLSVSHDGEWLAYDSDRSGNADIYRVRIDGGDPVQITTNPGGDFAPAWSAERRLRDGAEPLNGRPTWLVRRGKHARCRGGRCRANSRATVSAVDTSNRETNPFRESGNAPDTHPAEGPRCVPDVDR